MPPTVTVHRPEVRTVVDTQSPAGPVVRVYVTWGQASREQLVPLEMAGSELGNVINNLLIQCYDAGSSYTISGQDIPTEDFIRMNMRYRGRLHSFHVDNITEIVAHDFKETVRELIGDMKNKLMDIVRNNNSIIREQNETSPSFWTGASSNSASLGSVSMTAANTLRRSSNDVQSNDFVEPL